MIDRFALGSIPIQVSVTSIASSPTMHNLLLALLLIAPVAHADSWVAVVNGPTWHATSKALNWRTLGAGIGHSYGPWTIAVGGYDNSDHRHSAYVGIQWVHPLSGQWVYGGELALATGYGYGRLTPIPLGEIGYRMGPSTLVFGIVPRTPYNPALVNAQLQVNF
jgi:hypothetical protein